MKTLLIVLFFLIIAPSFAQQQIKAEDAKNYAGDSVKICSKIYDTKYFKSSKDPITLLDMGDKYPNNPLSIVIPADVRKLFKSAPEEYYKGAQVCVTGKIQIYKEKAEIVIGSPQQIQEVIMDKLPVKGPE